ncbi:DNA gyrase inhibitor YacG [Thauera linaloolentis]|uniref:DNA gyrase inhibitor YacG n=1 Tax=Thauera linaloolentis (strain DSM 12138 / JCM 21573 / CCUG 41526 / CIP 105981 / IAM 15112 / NBRC 102519 / 47Lol) TaxID=1123367 RepID=N6YVY8_THAL4|nr:DNA gyrase inhibitor YacG [Thauera linaloolentis]ENO86587.1 hypothetical protein C666_12910 [Thauera linaloolentis 47Lol = DSM 12138]MCM8565773.1 DNA gyrase inhibitor YacG [Thauera linaloolentis]
MSNTPRTVSCPACGKAVVWTTESRYRPFCSARCRQIDLGAWASEAYRVPSSPPDAGDGEEFPPPGTARG